jgi:ABC-type phosphate transport system substrate-binding protein
MTRTLRAPSGAWRAALAALLIAAAALLAFAVTPAADAAFVTGECQGTTNLNGRGASFQTGAHTNVFSPQFNSFYCAGEGGGPIVTYSGGGSGLGRRHMGERTSASGAGENNLDGSLSRSYPERFTGTDEPLTPTHQAEINEGTDADGDEGEIHQIPVAAGAVAPIVNFPDHCDVESIPIANQTAPRNIGELTPAYEARVKYTNRARFTQAQWEKIWNGAQTGGDKAASWGDIFSDLKAIVGNPAAKTDQMCKDQQITRVVRFDDSGTSFAFKDALDSFNAARGWLPDFVTGPDTRNWPNAALDNGSFCNAGVPDPLKASPVGVDGPDAGTTPSLVSACANGNNNLVPKLAATDGSVGYSDLDTLTKTGGNLLVTPTTVIANRDDDKYVTQLPNGAGDFTEATKFSGGYKTDNAGGTGGANCADTEYVNVPDSTLGDWSNVSGVNDVVGYAICTLTYILAFDDNADAYGNTPAEEDKARTVKDYLAAALTTSEQNDLESGNYSPLPAGMLAVSQAGVDHIDWNEEGGGGGCTSNCPPPPCVTNCGGTPPPIITPPAKPSNVFSVPRTSLDSKKGWATLSIRLPGAGKLVLDAKAKVKSGKKTKTIKVGKITRTVSKAGTVKLTLKPSSAAKKVLRKKGKLKVTIKLTYTPTGGTARTSNKTVTLKLKKKRK